MDKYYAWAIIMTFIYSIIGFINRNSNEESKENLKSKLKWTNALSTATIDSGFAILFFSGLHDFFPEWGIMWKVAMAVFAGVFLAETFVNKMKEVVTTWKI